MKHPKKKRKAGTYQFRGTWAHGDLFHLLENGTITSSEFVLCLVVDSLVRCRGEGCFASNKLLGKKTHVTPRMIRYQLSKLRKLGLIIDVPAKDRRIMETRWSRVAGELQARNKLHGGGNRFPGGEEADFPRGILDTNVSSINTSVVGTAARQRSNTHQQNGRYTSPNRNHRTTPTILPIDHTLAKQLMGVLAKKRGIHRRPTKTDASTFATLRRSIKNDIIRLCNLMDWYEDNAGERVDLGKGKKWKVIIYDKSRAWCYAFSTLEDIMNQSEDEAPPEAGRMKCVGTADGEDWEDD